MTPTVTGHRSSERSLRWTASGPSQRLPSSAQFRGIYAMFIRCKKHGLHELASVSVGYVACPCIWRLPAERPESSTHTGQNPRAAAAPHLLALPPLSRLLGDWDGHSRCLSPLVPMGARPSGGWRSSSSLRTPRFTLFPRSLASLHHSP